MKRLLLAVAVLATIGMTTNAQATIGWAGNVWPLYGASVVPTGPVTVYAQVYKGGATDSPGQGAGITAELRYTTDIAPMVAVPMVYNADIGNNDEYKGDVPQAALVGAAWVDVTVIFTDTTDNTTFEVTGDQQGHVPPLRYFVTNVTPVPIDVTFTLCMSGTATNGAPCVIGSAAEIGTWGTGVTMNSLGGELWQVTVTFAAGSNPAFEYKYKITLFEDSWQELDEKGQKANLFRLLCHLDHKEDKEENDVFFLRSPEYHYFAEELQQFGVWQTDEQHYKLVDILDNLRQAIQGAATLIRTTAAPGEQEIPSPVVKVAVSSTAKGGAKSKKAPPRITGLKPPTLEEDQAAKEIEEQLVTPSQAESEEPEEDLSHMDLDL